MTSLPLALELYTVRDETARDFVGTIRKVAEMGYDGVEVAGYGGLSAEEMRALLTETGLRAYSTHVGLEPLQQHLEQEIAYCTSIDCPYLVLPWLPPVLRTEEAIRSLIPLLNEIGQRCYEQGITFGYHNHDFEFVTTASGMRLLDLLLSGTDPAFVSLELDVYWAQFAGVAPASVLQQYAGRVPLVHLKDMTADRHFTEVGDGVMNLAQLLPLAEQSGAKVFLVENDAPQMPSLDSARRSLANLRQMA